eukprot:508127-Pelagomonas_calceolata.AAC.2
MQQPSHVVYPLPEGVVMDHTFLGHHHSWRRICSHSSPEQAPSASPHHTSINSLILGLHGTADKTVGKCACACKDGAAAEAGHISMLAHMLEQRGQQQVECVQDSRSCKQVMGSGGSCWEPELRWHAFICVPAPELHAPAVLQLCNICAGCAHPLGLKEGCHLAAWE